MNFDIRPIDGGIDLLPLRVTSSEEHERRMNDGNDDDGNDDGDDDGDGDDDNDNDDE